MFRESGNHQFHYLFPNLFFYFTYFTMNLIFRRLVSIYFMYVLQCCQRVVPDLEDQKTLFKNYFGWTQKKLITGFLHHSCPEECRKIRKKTLAVKSFWSKTEINRTCCSRILWNFLKQSLCRAIPCDFILIKRDWVNDTQLKTFFLKICNVNFHILCKQV